MIDYRDVIGYLLSLQRDSDKPAKGYGYTWIYMNDRRISSGGRQIKLQTAPEAAAQAIREAIISGELQGGDRIIEQRWATRLGIGQPTLREALTELDHQGLLRRLPQRGTYVAQLSPEDYRLIQEVRIPLEAIAIGKAAENLSPEAEAELTAIVASMTGTGMDVKKFHDCDVAFHRKIWELANNEFLRETLETVTFRLFVFSVVDRWPDNPNAMSEHIAAVQQHLAILEGLKSKNKGIARRTFIRQTISYWNTQYGLNLSEKDLSIDSLSGENASAHRGRDKVGKAGIRVKHSS